MNKEELLAFRELCLKRMSIKCKAYGWPMWQLDFKGFDSYDIEFDACEDYEGRNNIYHSLSWEEVECSEEEFIKDYCRLVGHRRDS